ncbi:MAG TPA: methyltransferase domain-containing protein [Planctomycetes bacterium]|nr:methyltransferase domain-containing protein [Planctomycetota bacterium]
MSPSELERVLEPEAMDTTEEAEGYDRMDHRAANASFSERLFELGATGHLLDIGTGPAHLPIMICERDQEVRVTAIDLAHEMLRVARRNIVASGLEDRIELLHGDAKQLQLPTASFDGVYSNTILHHIPDPRPFLREAARLLRPAGVLLIRDLFRPRDEARLKELVELYTVGCDDYQRALFAASLRAAFTPEELREVCNECDLAAAEVVVDSDRHVSILLRASPRHGR